ncbi:ParB/RepB/Spo0J family partition protein [Schaalia sp. HMT-877]|nr:ParB/RepB/Spo0J family partition protein [Schaalia sp. HMT-877]
MSTYVDQEGGRARVPAGTVSLTEAEALSPQDVTAVGGRYAVAPELLKIRKNVRRALKVDEAFVESVRALGVVKDLDVYASPVGLVVLDGHRRLAAAMEAGLPLVPVRVVPSPGEADRIGLQLLSNDAGRRNSAVDRADAITQLVLLGASAGDLRAHGVRRFEQVTAQKVTGASAEVRALEASAGLDMVALAKVADLEEETSPDFAAEVSALIEADPEMLDHIMECARMDYEAWEAAQAQIKEARAAGARILGEEEKAGEAEAPAFLCYLRDAETGELIREEDHRSCPGRALRPFRGAANRVVTMVDELCLDPGAHGHVDVRVGPRAAAVAAHEGRTEEEVRAQVERRRAAEERMKAVKAAHSVRREWVGARLLAAGRAPADADLMIAHVLRGLDSERTCFAPAGRILIAKADGGMYTGRRPTGIRSASRSVLEWAVAQSEGAIGAGEIPQRWEVRVYLRSLERWGYRLSPIEEEFCKALEADDEGADALPKERTFK